mmetsp:Transcript_25865/g.67826  ORF Transcript_25865/g.67826 Transcript_25865/m.67826 type:complete len:86 (-) Transcript_25865:1422-1679(-)
MPTNSKQPRTSSTVWCKRQCNPKERKITERDIPGVSGAVARATKSPEGRKKMCVAYASNGEDPNINSASSSEVVSSSVSFALCFS